jgi:hypothetical protein
VKLTAAKAIILVALAFSACCRPPENPRVEALCTPVRDLLSKNLKESAGLSIIGFGGSEAFERSGVQLEADQATRIVEIDYACRAHALGALSDEDYKTALITIYGGGLAISTDGRPSQAMLADLARGIQGLQEAGAIPKGDVASAAANLARASSTDASRDLEALRATLSKIRLSNAEDIRFRSELLGKLSALELTQARIASPRAPRQVSVSFATGSIEIPEIYDILLRSAAAIGDARA